MKHEDRYVWFDLIRGLSALAVCFRHLRAVIFVDYAQLPTSSIAEKVFYFGTGLGHQAVMVFFVLSGFFVGGSVLRRRHVFAMSDYVLARVVRLWVVLVPALFFTLLVDQILVLYAADLLSGAHYVPLNSGPQSAAEYSSSLTTFLGNLLFVQTIYTPVLGSNDPLWSLANEFWYYLLFPLGLIATGAVQRQKIKRLVAALTFVLISWLVPTELTQGFIIWLLGVGVFIVYRKHCYPYHPVFSVFGALLFLFSLVDSKINVVQSYLYISNDLFVGISFSLFLISIKDRSNTKQLHNVIKKVSKWLAEISYTLYLFHFPFVLLLYALFYKDRQTILTMASGLQFLMWLACILGGCRALWWLFERNTHVVRKYIQSRIEKSSKNSQSHLPL